MFSMKPINYEEEIIKRLKDKFTSEIDRDILRELKNQAIGSNIINIKEYTEKKKEFSLEELFDDEL